MRWEPTPKQAEFLAAIDDEVLFGGAAGPGKSEALVVDALGLPHEAITYPRYRAVLFRLNYPQLAELVDRSRLLYPAVAPGAKYNESSHEWVFPSGAVIRFRYLDSEADRWQYHGMELQWVGWDELTMHATDVSYRFLIGRTRCSWGDIPCYTRATTNPGGPGHMWVRERFRIQDHGSPTRFRLSDTVDGEKLETTRRFISARLVDNPHLADNDPTYRQRLLGLPEAERRKLLDGRWDVVEGAYFRTWTPDVHVIDPPALQPEWRYWRSMDWGYAAPYCVLWYAMDEAANIYVWRELYGIASTGVPNEGCRASARDVALRILDMEKGERREYRYNPADRSIWNESGHASRAGMHSIADRFRAEGVAWTPAAGGPRSRVNGWAEIVLALTASVDDARRDESQGGGLYISRACEHLIRTLPAMQHDPKHPEDLDTRQEDHAVDALRYGVVSRRMTPTKAVKPKLKHPLAMDNVAPLRRKTVQL